MPLISIHDKATIKAVTDRNPRLHLFERGDESYLPELQAFYREVYPENWFSPRMLATQRYYGIRLEGKIVSVAGVHVYSPAYDAAVLGNVATHPRMRGHGLARLACARLCHELLQDGIHNIGLVVHAHNTSAIAVYQALGFEPVAEIGTYMLTAN